MKAPHFSIVVPVYNRPQEVDELLESLTRQTFREFEVLIIEDGSSITCESVCQKYQSVLDLHYFTKPNSGPGPSRNFGFAKARGTYFVVFDSDCIIPEQYLQIVFDAIGDRGLDAWGGPDRAHNDFTIVQQAMGYTMASVLTTGGIRGGKKRVGWFQPRSFNMGISRKVFETTGGFHFDRYAEDIEFSIRMKHAGFRVELIADAFVYHKRRTSLSQFFRQVSNFGKGRALIGRKYPAEVKLTHWFPTLFSIGIISVFLLPFISMSLFYVALTGLGIYLVAIFADAWMRSGKVSVGVMSVPSALIQFFGYGFGFLSERLGTYTKK